MNEPQETQFNPNSGLLSGSAPSEKCLNRNCSNHPLHRGLCVSCYQSALRLVKKARTTWAALEASGKCTAPKYHSSIKGTTKWLLSANREPTSGVGSAWVCAETKPPAGKKVMVCGHYHNGKQWRTLARWMPAGTLDATMWENPPDEWWDKSENKCSCPYDAWWEESIELEQMMELCNITHWMVLPEMPNVRVGENGGDGK